MRDKGIFQNEEPIKYPPKLFIGAVANPFGDPFEFRVIRLEKKNKGRCRFFQTQSIFELG